MNDLLGRFKVKANVAIAVGLIGIVSVMIIPVPVFLLDLLLSLTLSLSIIILLITVYTKRSLDFSAFPSILLIMTLFRLALNVATTRSILLRGGSDGLLAAGTIIRAFGQFVVEGNYVVGIIIFTILVIINFLVITKGAGRVAEVTARFTLDAMPGKQMAIDADLNAGIIDETQAKKRRREISDEADFYGSMDGASKFVRGDAIAGILITAINIIGGIVIGMIQNNMSFEEASTTFVILTIGDGLVTQIPALLISTAAGLITTRNTSDYALGDQLGKQFRVHSKSVLITSIVLFTFAVIPGLPKLPFVIMGIILFTLSRAMKNSVKEENESMIKAKTREEKNKAQQLEELLTVELIELELGYGLVNLVDNGKSGDLVERVSHIRRQFVLDWGIIIPQIKIKDNLELKSGGYKIKIKGIDVAKGELLPNHYLAMDPGEVVSSVEGIETVEPVFGLPALWISENDRDDASYAGYTVVDLATVIATHITEILKSNLNELIGRQELTEILDKFKQQNPKLVSDLIPEVIKIGSILKVCQNLLREGVPIRDLRTILEKLAEYVPRIKDDDMLTEKVREGLYRTITLMLKNSKGEIPIITLDRTLEELVVNNLMTTEEGIKLSLDPKDIQAILAKLNVSVEDVITRGERPVVLCSPAIRYHFKKLTEKFIPNLVVVSHNELSGDVNLKSLGTVRL